MTVGAGAPMSVHPIRAAATSKSPPRIVAEVMTHPVCTIPRSATAREAAARMLRNRLRHLIVLDDRGRAVGVLSDRDLKTAQPSALMLRDPEMRAKALSLVRVSEVMVKYPQVIRPEQSIADALRVMLQFRIGCVPVIKADEELVGILTGGDVAKLALSLLE